MKRSLLVVSALLVAGALPALAADLPVKAPIAPPVPVPTWTGFYVGLHAGYGWSDVDWQEGGFSASHSGEGALAGGQVGFNLQAGRLVYGIEADLSSAWIEGGLLLQGK